MHINVSQELHQNYVSDLGWARRSKLKLMYSLILDFPAKMLLKGIRTLDSPVFSAKHHFVYFFLLTKHRNFHPILMFAGCCLLLIRILCQYASEWLDMGMLIPVFITAITHNKVVGQRTCHHILRKHDERGFHFKQLVPQYSYSLHSQIVNQMTAAFLPGLGDYIVLLLYSPANAYCSPLSTVHHKYFPAFSFSE